MQRILDLLTTISADAAGYVSFRQMFIQHVYLIIIIKLLSLGLLSDSLQSLLGCML